MHDIYIYIYIERERERERERKRERAKERERERERARERESKLPAEVNAIPIHEVNETSFLEQLFGPGEGCVARTRLRGTYAWPGTSREATIGPGHVGDTQLPALLECYFEWT